MVRFADSVVCGLTPKLSGENRRLNAKHADRTHAGFCPLERMVRLQRGTVQTEW
jgi:hypothetical protein